jgi:CDP-2,3-bis-(O-geranylgeranyl)-sn-glycerol synthase
MNDLLFSLWFFAPAGCANMAPIFAAHMPYLKSLSAPLDGGKTFRGQPVFGPHKTWRGLIAAVIVGIAVVCLQRVLYTQYEFFRSISDSVNYAVINPVALGALLGAGAIIGDAVKSFFKRRAGVPSGHSWFPFDQTDYIIGGLLFSSLVVQLSPFHYLLICAVWVLLHLGVSYLGYLLKLKDAPI